MPSSSFLTHFVVCSLFSPPNSALLFGHGVSDSNRERCSLLFLISSRQHQLFTLAEQTAQSSQIHSPHGRPQPQPQPQPRSQPRPQRPAIFALFLTTNSTDNQTIIQHNHVGRFSAKSNGKITTLLFSKHARCAGHILNDI